MIDRDELRQIARLHRFDKPFGTSYGVAHWTRTSRWSTQMSRKAAMVFPGKPGQVGWITAQVSGKDVVRGSTRSRPTSRFYVPLRDVARS